MPTFLLWFAFGVVAIVGATVVWLWVGYHRLEQHNRKVLAANGVVVETESGTIEYATAGSGFPVLVSHGGAGGYDQGLITALAYLGEGLMAIAPSRFGHLRTPLASDSSAVAQADAYVHLLDALGIERVAVLGTSGGGPSALQLAQRHPERVASLVLSASRYRAT